MSAVSRQVIAAALTIGTMACAKLGYTDRVRWRLPSPDGKWLAVCQEVPEFDGPSYAVRLQRPDGTVIGQIYQNGDGDPCSEMAWSPDSRTLAILSGHVARVRFIDVAWALEHMAEVRRVFWPQIDLGNERLHRNAGGLRFTGPREIELQVCGERPYTPGDAGRRSCGADAETRRIAAPDFPGRR
jgi:hypothetical protein